MNNVIRKMLQFVTLIEVTFIRNGLFGCLDSKPGTIICLGQSAGTTPVNYCGLEGSLTIAPNFNWFSPISCFRVRDYGV